MKALLRQVLPPILITLGKAVLYRQPLALEEQKSVASHDQIQAQLKAEHELRNKDVNGNEILLRDNLKLKVHPDSRDGFEHFCYKHTAMVDEMNCFIANTKDKRNLLDVGALHGVFSLIFAMQNPSRKAVAVDASPLAFARLLYNIHTNNLQNVVPVECALSEGDGSISMHYEWEHAVAAKSRNPGLECFAVETRTGDALCETLYFEPDVIKIDVEGHEVKVIRGLESTITRHKPLVFLEVHPKRILDEGESLDDLVSIFSECGYHACLVNGDAFAIEELPRVKEDQRLILRSSS